MVSSGRSHRERVGLERSGSAGRWCCQRCVLSACMQVAPDSPIGLPLASLCWNERRDCRVGFSSAAATGRCQHTIHDSLFTLDDRRQHTGLGFVHGGVGVRLCGGIVVGLAALAVTFLATVLALWALRVGVVVFRVLAAKAEGARLCASAPLLGPRMRRIHGCRHVYPVFSALRLQRGWRAGRAEHTERWTAIGWSAARCWGAGVGSA